MNKILKKALLPIEELLDAALDFCNGTSTEYMSPLEQKMFKRLEKACVVMNK